MQSVVHETAVREQVDKLVARGRVAMDAFADADQARADEAVTALAWSI